jgi:hypothetical protein
MDIDKIRQAFADIEHGMNALRSGPLDYYTNKLIGAYSLLLSRRFAPFVVGDTVILTKAPDIDRPDHGWLASKHFLIEGAVGKIITVEADAGGFGAYVQFENDSWVDNRSGVVTLRPEKDRGNYWLHEDFLVLTSPQRASKL